MGAPQHSRFGHRSKRRRRIHIVEPVTHPQPIGQKPCVGVELGNVVLAHGQNHPQMGVGGERLAQLAKKVLTLVPLLRVGGEDLFKLVDHQHPIGLLTRPPGQKVGEPLAAQRDLPLVPWVQIPQQIVDIDIRYRCDRQISGQLTADPRPPQHHKPLCTQRRQQTCVDQRTFASTRRRIKKHAAIRHHQRKQIGPLALTAKKELLLTLVVGKRARANVRILRTADFFPQLREGPFEIFRCCHRSPPQDLSVPTLYQQPEQRRSRHRVGKHECRRDLPPD